MRERIAAASSETAYNSLNYRPPAPESYVPQSGGIVPWASAPVVKGALTHTKHGVTDRRALALKRVQPRRGRPLPPA